MLKEFREFAVKGMWLTWLSVSSSGSIWQNCHFSCEWFNYAACWYYCRGHDFSGLSIKIGSAQILYGSFIQTVVDFLIISFSIFIFIRYLNKLKRKKVEEEEVVETPDQTEVLLTEIRDLLKNQSQSKDVQ